MLYRIKYIYIQESHIRRHRNTKAVNAIPKNQQREAANAGEARTAVQSLSLDYFEQHLRGFPCWNRKRFRFVRRMDHQAAVATNLGCDSRASASFSVISSYISLEFAIN